MKKYIKKLSLYFFGYRNGIILPEKVSMIQDKRNSVKIDEYRQWFKKYVIPTFNKKVLEADIDSGSFEIKVGIKHSKMSADDFIFIKRLQKCRHQAHEILRECGWILTEINFNNGATNLEVVMKVKDKRIAHL